MKTTEEMEHECNRMPVTLGYLKMRNHAKAMEAEVTRMKRWIADNPEAQSELVKDLTEERDAAMAKLSERKTVHQWLNAKGTPRDENGKPICLLRRLAIALEIHEPQPGGELMDCLAVRPECRDCGTLMDYGQAIPPAVVVMDHGQQTEGAWDGVVPLVAVWKCPSCGHSFSNAEVSHGDESAIKMQIKPTNNPKTQQQGGSPLGSPSC